MQNRKRDTDVQKRLLDSVGEGEGGMFWENSIGKVYYQGWNRSPSQVGCMRQVLGAGALGRPRGMGWRGRWEGGLGWGTHVNPWLIHVNVWQKPQYCKVISLQLIKKKKIQVLFRRTVAWDKTGEGQRGYTIQGLWTMLTNMNVALSNQNWGFEAGHLHDTNIMLADVENRKVE